jgi:nucleoside-diphosphate-sugar epimerase
MEVNNNQKYKLLVIGGTGFIGRHIVKKSLELGFDTTSLSKSNPMGKDKIKGATYIEADIIDRQSLSNNLGGKKFDYVVNSSGYINHSNYSNDGSKIFDAHFYGVKNLVDCLNKDKIKRFVQFGSSDEYGSNIAPQNEKQKESPIAMYSCAKVASTYFLKTLYKTENFPSVILRPFLIYGPNQGKDRLIPQIIMGCINDEKFPVSEGMQLRDFLFIDDFIDVVFLTLCNNNVLGEIINISSGIPVTIKKVINIIVNTIKSGQPQFGKIKYRDGENMKLYGDITKVKTLLNWKPRVDLETGLYKTIESIKAK